MNDPLEEYRDAYSAFHEAAAHTREAERALQSAQDDEAMARNVKVKAERAMQRFVIMNPPQQLPLGVIPQ